MPPVRPGALLLPSSPRFAKSVLVATDLGEKSRTARLESGKPLGIGFGGLSPRTRLRRDAKLTALALGLNAKLATKKGQEPRGALFGPGQLGTQRHQDDHGVVDGDWNRGFVRLDPDLGRLKVGFVDAWRLWASSGHGKP